MDSDEQYCRSHPAQKVEDTLYEVVFRQEGWAYLVDTLTGRYWLFTRDERVDHNSADHILLPEEVYDHNVGDNVVEYVPYREKHQVSYTLVERIASSVHQTKSGGEVIMTFEEAAARCGWTPATQVEVLLDYIRYQQSAGAFEDFLLQRVEEEEGYSSEE
jgi:hypothetical protein